MPGQSSAGGNERIRPGPSTHTETVGPALVDADPPLWPHATRRKEMAPLAAR